MRHLIEGVANDRWALLSCAAQSTGNSREDGESRQVWSPLDCDGCSVFDSTGSPSSGSFWLAAASRNAAIVRLKPGSLRRYSRRVYESSGETGFDALAA